MEGIVRDGVVQAELFVRSELPGPSQQRAEAVEGQLRAMAGDVVDDVAHRSWPKRVPVDRCGSTVRDVYLEWSDWARCEGVSLQPFFDTRECYCPEAEAYTDWLVVPALALAVTVDDELAAVYPHVDGTETVAIENGLDALEGAETSAADAQVSAAD